MNRLFFLLLAVAIVFSRSSFCALAIEPSTDSLETIKKNIDDKKAVLIDVRELNEWSDGHLQDARIDESETPETASPNTIVTIAMKLTSFCQIA